MWSNEDTDLFPQRYQKLIKWYPCLVYFCQELKRFEPAVACLQWFIDVNTWQSTTLIFKLVFQLENFWIRICQVGKSLLFVGNPGCDFIGGCGCQDEASQTQLKVGSWSVNEKLYVFTYLLLAVFNSDSFQTLVSSNKNTSIDSPDIMTQYKQSKKGNCK